MNKNIIIAIITIGFLFACKSETKPAEKATATVAIENVVSLSDAQYKNADIEIGTMGNQLISTIIKASGKIDVPPQNLVSISVPSGGYLKTTSLLEGMHVNKGQVLCTIEDKQFLQMQEDYLMARAKIGYAKAEYERQKELNKSKASSDKVYQQAQSEYNSLSILIQSYAEKLKFAGINPNNVSTKNMAKSINVYSPINGYVSKVNVNIGKYVTPSDVLFEIVNPTDIHLALNIFEKDIVKLSVGQLVQAYSNNNPERKYPCEIILLGKDFSENRSTEIHCHFNKYDKTLLPGMYMNADIIVESQLANTLPEDAIVSFENKQYVFTEKDKKSYQMLEVNTKNTKDGFTEITSNNIAKDVKVVIKGAYTLLMALKNNEED